MSFVIQRNSIIVFFMVFVACASNAQTANDNRSIKVNLSDSVLSKILINNTFWTQWGNFSTITDFAEINFISKQLFQFKWGRINQINNQKDTVIYEVYTGIWHIKDSVITMIHSNRTFGMIENHLKWTHLNQLLVMDFSNLVGDSHVFIQKPYALRLHRLQSFNSKN